MAAYTTSDAQFWRKGKTGGMVPYDHRDSTDELWSGGTAAPTGGPGQPAQTPGATSGGVLPPSPITPGGQLTVSGGSGHSSITTSPHGQVTANAPTIGTGRTVNNPLDMRMRDQVMALLRTDPNQASVADADIAPQAEAYAAARERVRRQQQQANATALGARGLASSGASDSARNTGFETAGQDIAAFNADLVGKKMLQRQQVLEQAIQTASALGMHEEAANLQRQLSDQNAQLATMSLGQGSQGQVYSAQVANMDAGTKTYLANLDADLRREGISAADRLATMDNELRRYGIDVQGNLGVLDAVLRMMGMDQQNTQFNDSLGWDMSKFQFGANNNLVASLLNG